MFEDGDPELGGAKGLRLQWESRPLFKRRSPPPKSQMTNSLLNNEFVATTSEIAFLECSVNTVMQVYTEWAERIFAPRHVTVHSTRTRCVDLKCAVKSLYPLTTIQARRYLMLQTNKSWTAIFCNRSPAPDLGGMCGYLAETIGCRGLEAVYVPDDVKDKFPACMFTLYGPTRTDWLNTVRAIYATYDGYTWDFGATGTPQPFEDLAAYNAKRIRDRFTPEMLNLYCKALGIDIFDESFYTISKTYRLELMGEHLPTSKEIPLPSEKSDFSATRSGRWWWGRCRTVCRRHRGWGSLRRKPIFRTTTSSELSPRAAIVCK